MRELHEDIASLKTTEAISILRTINKGIDNLLANFEVPGKIDLVNYMEKNIRFNLPLEKLGYLTERSWTIFKRDFSKAHNTTTERWLTNRRWVLSHDQFIKKWRNSLMFTKKQVLKIFHFFYAFKNNIVIQLPNCLAS